MTREQAEREIRYTFTEVWADEIIKALEQEPTTKNDLPHCQHTDEEIAKSFIEDVEAVKDQLPTTKNDLGVDCIDRAEVLKLMQDNWHTHNGDWAMQESMDDIRALPPVTPIRPKGHWIETAEEYYKAINEKGGGVNENTDFFTDDIACSECLAKFNVIDNEADRFDFCPCCGSDNR